MSWDESLFKTTLQALGAILRKKAPPSPEQANQVALSDVSGKLTLLAAALLGRAVEIKEAEGAGGALPHVIFLPGAMDLSADPLLNAQAYVYRVAYSCTALKLGAFLPSGPREALGNPEAELEASLQALPRIRAALEAELPLSRELLSRLAGTDHPDSLEFQKKALKLWGILKPQPPTIEAGALAKPTELFQVESLSSGTEKRGKPKENATEVKLGDDHLDENPLVHSFEKVRTAEEYQGGKKTQDGSDELQEHLDALDELDLRQVIRSRERARSIYKCDAIIDGGAPDLVADEDEEPPASCHKYDEWNEKARAYRKEWCSVFESPPAVRRTPREAEAMVRGILERRQKEVRELRQRLTSLLTERKWRNRQTDGAEIDMDAVIDRYATLRSGHSPPDRLYLLRRKHHQDIAVLILLDSSLSTDSWVENRRVLDVARESVLILGEALGSEDSALAALGDRVAVASFYSNTRRDCRFRTLKGFDEGWKSCRSRIASLEPEGYTRIGPALRHGTALLARTPARRKLLLLVSDGKPTDYDRYEGRYGIADVRQAIREAQRQNVRVRALAVESQARFHLPQMFGDGNFKILPHPGLLVENLDRILKEALLC